MSTTAADATTTTTTNSDTGSSDSGRSGVTGRVRDAAGSASTRAADAYSSARDRTSSAFGNARETASRATQRTSERIDTNPMGAIIGGLALGGILAWVLPKTQRETETLGGVGHKLTDTARQAAQTAFDAGKQQVNEIKDNAATKVGQAVIDAVSSTTGAGSNNQQ